MWLNLKREIKRKELKMELKNHAKNGTKLWNQIMHTLSHIASFNLHENFVYRSSAFNFWTLFSSCCLLDLLDTRTSQNVSNFEYYQIRKQYVLSLRMSESNQLKVAFYFNDLEQPKHQVSNQLDGIFREIDENPALNQKISINPGRAIHFHSRRLKGVEYFFQSLITWL